MRDVDDLNTHPATTGRGFAGLVGGGRCDGPVPVTLKDQSLGEIGAWSVAGGRNTNRGCGREKTSCATAGFRLAARAMRYYLAHACVHVHISRVSNVECGQS